MSSILQLALTIYFLVGMLAMLQCEIEDQTLSDTYFEFREMHGSFESAMLVIFVIFIVCFIWPAGFLPDEEW